MNGYNCRLGAGLIPAESQIFDIYNLAEKLSTQCDLSFWVRPGISVPHVTLFQGRFKSNEEVIQALREVDFSYLNNKQTLSGLSLWAQKIIFLDCKESKDLQRVHENVYSALFPLCGQQRSFDTTGYPFSLEEYLPHFTIAHLRNPGQKRKHNIQKIFEELMQDNIIVFERAVLYKIGDLGRCLDFVYERKL
jgi:2'-5' RNA ligase